MSAETVGVLVEAGAMFFGGVYVTLFGYGLVGFKRGASPKVDAWHDKYGGIFRVGGPLTAIGALVILAIQLVS